LRHAADPALRGPAGLRGRHTGCYVLFDELIEMETKFGFEFRIDLRPAKQRPQTQTDFVYDSHH
jgi:hypothetical protein